MLINHEGNKRIPAIVKYCEIVHANCTVGIIENSLNTTKKKENKSRIQCADVLDVL